MDAATDAPQSRYYHSQGLRLHFTDWGNPQAPPLLAVSIIPAAGIIWRARCGATFISWRPTSAGNGESEWAIGSSYSLADHVYDLTGLVKAAGFEDVPIVGHSMGGMVSLTYAGVFPEKVSHLVVLDGVTNYPARRVKPADIRPPSACDVYRRSAQAATTA